MRRQAYEVLHYFQPIAGYREMANGVSFVWNSTLLELGRQSNPALW
jgi:hypothetical protein